MMLTTDESIDLARRAVAHFCAQTTDQAPDTMRLAAETYTDPERYRREVDRIFRQLPVALALGVELPAPKTYRAMTVMNVPVVLVRAEDGVVRAFLNVCRHRGAQLCKAGEGKLQRFVCPYHAWQYDLKGTLKGRYGEATFGKVGPDTHSLTELPCAERHGVIWVCLTPGEPFDIDRWLGDIGPKLEEMKLGSWHLHSQRELDGPGWKVAWDGYLESYHHTTVHPLTVGRYTIGNLTLHDTFGPHQRIVFARRTLEALKVTPEAEWDAEAHIRRIHLVFPNLAISGVIGGHCLVSQMFPGATPSSSVTRQTILCAHAPTSDEERKLTEEFSETALRAVRDEDYVVGAGVQQSLDSGMVTSFTIGRNEPAIQHFHATLAQFNTEQR
ncbi:hypothetical protein C7T35_32040 [Variovorax sp. WS11]|uniref:aromatic ring-hydroxylating oxygenase subunit alpha n=1 Tax=Variovorax sp. WS11 TaxID=1105204 RepID=UPI000D0DA3C9|nr:aromatic ring-hydroxylating dioxygenase subunit alpha [Variovorax sp. WS11]NDZ17730.1 aromatic ring-hydroxylating dioxygenase subunit alpha [Variovorax sp. WS11]PSL80466.1 hypothetical protein C7T35_32040 [Variovorax sp. WS11]